MGGKVGQVGGEPAEFGGLDVLDQQLIQRAGEILGEAQRLGGAALPMLLDEAAEQHQPQRRLDRGRYRLAVQRLQHSADPLVQLGITDGDQPRQQQAALRAPDERLLNRPRGAVVRDEHDTLREPGCPLAVLRDQPGGERIREGAVRRDGEDLWRHQVSVGSASSSFQRKLESPCLQEAGFQLSLE